VELSWAFFDRDLRTVFPRGDEKDACRFVGDVDGTERQYDLNVRLSLIGPCADNEEFEDCEVAEEHTFDCNRFRGYLPEVPAELDPYVMRVDVLVNPRSDPRFVASPKCVAVPGPRERTIRPGHVTDLAVYQFVVDATSFATGGSDPLDLEACNG
jgi:hypothetical protein